MGRNATSQIKIIFFAFSQMNLKSRTTEIYMVSDAVYWVTKEKMSNLINDNVLITT